MKLREACDSIKLECALRDLGYVDIGWRTVAHAGLYFLEPVGMLNECGPEDETLGFILGEEMFTRNPASVHFLFQSAKEAFDMAENLSDEFKGL